MNETELLNLLRPRALRWLAQREQSETELRRKLARLARTLQQQAVALAAASNADAPPEKARVSRRRRHAAAAAALEAPGKGFSVDDLGDAGGNAGRAPRFSDAGEAVGGRKAGEAAEFTEDDDASVPTALAPVVDQLIEWLRERHYLSDQRFVESRMRTRQSRFGLQRIQQELSQHGLSLGEAERQHLSDTELLRAHQVWVRKFGPELPLDATARATQSRFLMQRGFSTGVIRQVLKGAGFAAEALPE
ncbi:MAG: regulatory protein RecX [Pseudomonadota bacterium]